MTYEDQFNVLIVPKSSLKHTAMKYAVDHFTVEDVLRVYSPKRLGRADLIVILGESAFYVLKCRTREGVDKTFPISSLAKFIYDQQEHYVRLRITDAPKVEHAIR